MQKKSQFIYHAKPKGLQGETLYPLHLLAHVYPEAHALALQKYAWRKSLLAVRIPRLDCLWNDVLHFSTVHPHEIYEALQTAGKASPPSWQFYEIPLSAVQDLPHALYECPPAVCDENVYSETEQAPPYSVDPARIKLPGEFQFTSPEFPQATRDYFQFEISRGRSPLLFYGLPHFLLQASLPLAAFRLIDWSEEPG